MTLPLDAGKGRALGEGRSTRPPRHLYLIERGPNFAEGFHPSLTPHRVIVCTRKHTAKWEAGWTGDAATVWERSASDGGEGWLIVRSRGLDIDYGHVVRGGTLPDGTPMGFSHPGNAAASHRRPWELLRGAIWWSEDGLPAWLANRGVIHATDAFTIERIAEDIGKPGRR